MLGHFHLACLGSDYLFGGRGPELILVLKHGTGRIFWDAQKGHGVLVWEDQKKLMIAQAQHNKTLCIK